MDKPRIAINGFGRIGRLFFRQAFEQFDIVAINDLSQVETLAYLLRHDTVYRAFPQPIAVVTDGAKKYLAVGDRKTLIVQEKDPGLLPWKDLNIDVVVEATGLFESFEKSKAHLMAGAKRVVISAPAKDAETETTKTVLLGVNEEQFKTATITSNGSCTTNATHPVAALLTEKLGVRKAFLTTVHGYTATQSLVDSVAKGGDPRRGRAAAMNIVPSASGVSVSVTRAVKKLENKFDGMALRVPTITGSIANFIFVAGWPTTVEEVNTLFKAAAQEERWKGILTVTDEPLVSSDVIGMPYGAVVDLSLTRVVDGDLVSVSSWYDNEWGYVSTLVQHVTKAAEALVPKSL